MSNDPLVAELAKDVREIRGHVLEIKETLAERRGERRIVVWTAGIIGGVAGTALTIGLKLAPFIHGLPK